MLNLRLQTVDTQSNQINYSAVNAIGEERLFCITAGLDGKVFIMACTQGFDASYPMHILHIGSIEAPDKESLKAMKPALKRFFN